MELSLKTLKIPAVIVFICGVCGMIAYILDTVSKGEYDWVAYVICGAIAVVGVVFYLAGQISQNKNEGQPTG